MGHRIGRYRPLCHGNFEEYGEFTGDDLSSPYLQAVDEFMGQRKEHPRQERGVGGTSSAAEVRPVRIRGDRPRKDPSGPSTLRDGLSDSSPKAAGGGAGLAEDAAN